MPLQSPLTQRIRFHRIGSKMHICVNSSLVDTDSNPKNLSVKRERFFCVNYTEIVTHSMFCVFDQDTETSYLGR